MGTRTNPLAGRYFNDPNFGAALSNLAAAFAPPDAQEMLGYEQLRGTRAENDRLSSLWDAAGGDFDRMGMAAGQWDPTQSYYAVDQSNATARRGQDLTYDLGARGQNVDLAQAYATQPLERTQAMAGLPPEIAAALGLPELAPTNGAVLGAEAKPMTEEQVRGQFLLGAQADGSLTDQDIWSMAMGDTPTMNVIDPVTNQPRVAFSGEAARNGATPFVNPGSKAGVDFGNYKAPDGREGSYIADPNTGTLKDAATGEPLPQGVTLYKLEGGSKDDATGATNANLTTYNSLSATLTQSDMILDDLSTLIQSNAGAAGLAGTLQSVAQDIGQTAREFDEVFGTGVDGMVNEGMISALGQSNANGPYDPVFQQIRSGMLQLAYLNAKRDNPSGEVSRFALERQLDALSQGLLGNDQSVLAALSYQRRANEIARASAERLIGNTPGTVAPIDPAGAGTGSTPAPGALQPVSATPAPASGGLPTVTTDAEYDALPAGAEFIGDDGKRYRKQ